jgi:hypothetical protein
LNKIKGVETFSSCSGHGFNTACVVMYCNNWEALIGIFTVVNSIRYKCGNSLDIKRHLWCLSIDNYVGEEKGLVVSIRYQWGLTLKKLATRSRIHMKDAWEELENAVGELNFLNKSKDK